jgi:hypothetical protein
LQVNVIGTAVLLDGGRLLRAPQDGLDDAAGQSAMLIEFKVVAEHLSYPQEARHRFGMDGECGRTQHDGVGALLVRSDDLQHVGVHPRCDVAREQLLAEFVEVAHQLATQIACCPFKESLELHAPQPVPHRCFEDSEQFADARLATPNPVTGVGRCGEAGDQRAVEVEERADARSWRTQGDRRDRI